MLDVLSTDMPSRGQTLLQIICVWCEVQAEGSFQERTGFNRWMDDLASLEVEMALGTLRD